MTIITLGIIFIVLLIVNFIRGFFHYKKHHKNYVLEFMNSQIPLDKIYNK